MTCQFDVKKLKVNNELKDFAEVGDTDKPLRLQFVLFVDQKNKDDQPIPDGIVDASKGEILEFGIVLPERMEHDSDSPEEAMAKIDKEFVHKISQDVSAPTPGGP